MRIKKKIGAVLLAVLLVLTCCPISAGADGVPSPSVSAQSAVLIEAQSGSVIYAKNANERLPMASTTKIMTALVALTLCPDTSKPICVPSAAVGVEGSSVYLSEGETLTLEHLLYALLLESANDAAVAIAYGLCGGVEAFANEMNRTAAALGAENTHFVNPHGLDDSAHYTTAADLARIASQAMQNETFCKIVSTRKATIPHAETNGVRLLISHNKLLRMYDGCIGIKTGFTKKSGRCLVSAAERDGIRLIAVTLNAPNDWNDHMALLSYGFSRYESVCVCEAGQYSLQMPVAGGDAQTITLSNRQELRLSLPKEHGKIRTACEARRFDFAPLPADTAMGNLRFYCDINGDGAEEMIGTLPLYSEQSIAKLPRKTFWQRVRERFGFSNDKERHPTG